MSRLPKAKVLEIRALLDADWPADEIADMLDVSTTTVYNIEHDYTYKEIDGQVRGSYDPEDEHAT